MRELQDLHRTDSDEPTPPVATAMEWAAVRSRDGCSGRSQPGQIQPCSATHVSTVSRRRARSCELRAAFDDGDGGRFEWSGQ